VAEMVRTIREVTGTADESWAEPVIASRRAGDPARVVASAATIEQALGWRAQWGVEDMVQSAWDGWLRHTRRTTAAATA
jgi:UDP-glucose 4-epimerase